MPQMMMDHEGDPRQQLLEKLGDISNIELFHNQVLLAVYIRPQKTKSGLYLTDSHVDEDRYQSKVGLLVKSGPQAFEQDGNWFSNLNFNENDWLVFRPSDGWSITVNGVLCRIFDDINIRGRVPHPDAVW
ncbi:co-chaperonin groeS [Caudoviricetes sp.]|nr:co-chaperonin groeS [Caudoviricetes sp.]